MRSNRVKRLVTRTVVAVTLLLSAWAVTGTTAQAQGDGMGVVLTGPTECLYNLVCSSALNLECS